MEFFDYFEQVYGERWPALLEALKGEGNAVRLQFGVRRSLIQSLQLLQLGQ